MSSRPQCRICARKMALDGSGQCYDCRNNPPKFRIGQAVGYITVPGKVMGIFTVSKIINTLDYGWEYGVKERVSWRINESELHEAK